jgi:hypothetical protein
MDRTSRWIAGGALAAILVGGGAGLAVATGAGGNDRPLTGSALENATDAALRYAGGGTVVETEVGDGGTAYEVVIRLDDGRHLEVSLDQRFRVIGQEVDDEGRGDDDGSNDD